MAFKKGGSQRPQLSISTSIFVRKGKYIKGPSFGLWSADNGPMARGTVKDDYLQELADFLQKAAKRDMGVSFALFENKDKKRSRDDDDDDEDWGKGKRKREEEEEDDEKPAKRKSKREEEEEEDEEKSSSRKSSKSEKSSGKSGKKSGGDWDFDDDD